MRILNVGVYIVWMPSIIKPRNRRAKPFHLLYWRRVRGSIRTLKHTQNSQNKRYIYNLTTPHTHTLIVSVIALINFGVIIKLLWFLAWKRTLYIYMHCLMYFATQFVRRVGQKWNRDWYDTLKMDFAEWMLNKLERQKRSGELRVKGLQREGDSSGFICVPPVCTWDRAFCVWGMENFLQTYHIFIMAKRDSPHRSHPFSK